MEHTDILRVATYNIHKGVRGIGPQRRPSVLFECVGVPGVIQQMMEGSPANARIVVVGVQQLHQGGSLILQTNIFPQMISVNVCVFHISLPCEVFILLNGRLSLLHETLE